MRLIFIRHAEPNYEKNSITDKGRREAELLSDRVSRWDHISEIYVSPLNRAQLTAAPSLRKLQREAVTVDWLQEFIYPVEDPQTDGQTVKHVPWDFYPEKYRDQDIFYDRDEWIHAWPYSSNPELEPAYREVCAGIDGVLEKHGYRRDGQLYRCDRSLTDGDDEECVLFFCHFGVTAMILSHILGIPAPQMTMNFVSLPTGITVLNAEKRNPEIAMFRVQLWGDTGHLTGAGEPVSHMAAFSGVFQG